MKIPADCLIFVPISPTGLMIFFKNSVLKSAFSNINFIFGTPLMVSGERMYRYRFHKQMC